MSRARSLAFSAALVAGTPSAASAHTPFEGANAFYAGLLHPLIVPGEALVLVALALLLGASGADQSRRGLLPLAAGLAAGLVLSVSMLGNPEWATPAMLSLALVMSVSVAIGLRAPTAVVFPAGFFVGGTVGLDAAAQQGSIRETLLAGSATIVGAMAIVLVIAGIVADRHQRWVRMGARVMAYWIAAAALLTIAWYSVLPH